MKSAFVKNVIIGITLLVAWIGLGVHSAVSQNPSSSTEAQIQPRFDQLEVEAVEFVQEHHPELVSLLQSLKSMRQKEYEMAIRDIVRIRKRLETLAKRDGESRTLELDAWKLQSKIDLLIAKGIARDMAFDTNVLRELLKLQVDNQKRRWLHEQSNLAKRQEQLAEQLARIEGHEDEKMEQQLSALLKRVENKIGKAKKQKQETKRTEKPK